MFTSRISHVLLMLLAGASASALAVECEESAKADAFPTSVKVDYVIGCMAANGQTYEMMQKCSCSIDLIEKAMPYSTYEHVSTLLSLQQMSGAGRNAVYKSSTWSQNEVARLREVQADSTLRCF